MLGSGVGLGAVLVVVTATVSVVTVSVAAGGDDSEQAAVKLASSPTKMIHAPTKHRG
jgi:hypothetical protein